MIKKKGKIKKFKLTRKYINSLLNKEFTFDVVEKICENKGQLLKLKIDLEFQTTSDWHYTLRMFDGCGKITILNSSKD